MKEFESTMTIIFGTATTLVVIILIYKVFDYFKNYNQLVPLKSSKALFAVNKIAWTLAMVVLINGLFLHALVLIRGSALAPQWPGDAFQVSLTQNMSINSKQYLFLF